MKGGIYTRQKCSICGGKLEHVEKRNGLYCEKHPQISANKFFIKYDTVFMNFKNYDLAMQQLNGFRYKDGVENSFDPRDYQKEKPLGFRNQAKEFMEFKKRQNLATIGDIQNHITVAGNYFQDKNIKEFKRRDIRKFLYSLNVSDKTRDNYLTSIKGFFDFLYLDEIITIDQKPIMPKIEWDLKYRNLTDFETQRTILDKIHEMTYSINPKIWLGVDMLSMYTNIRPADLLKITEADIDIEYGTIEFKRPTKKRKQLKKIIIRLLDEHLSVIKELKQNFPAMPHMPFFRHHGGVSGCKINQPFGEKLFYKWWKKACGKLGIYDLDLYGGTRHTTTTGLAKVAGKDAARKASQHKSNKAFDRYCQAADEDTFKYVKIARKTREGKIIEIKRKAEKIP